MEYFWKGCCIAYAKFKVITCSVAILRRLSIAPSCKFMSEIEMWVGKCSSGRSGVLSSRRKAFSKSHASYTLMSGATSAPASSTSRNSFWRARDPGLRKTPSFWISLRIVFINGYLRFWNSFDFNKYHYFFQHKTRIIAQPTYCNTINYNTSNCNVFR